ncbi:hypothetical protein RJT34_09228 [Clitoria ternatea]|uniref:Tify domain-containing protein n=1 Tax=Clitoria ternatea TaxID=43366 RepID=A0AAN9PT68_CLITE
MDNAWQMKCDSAFQSSKAPNVQSPEPTVLAEITANHYLLPQVAHGLRSEFAGGKLGHVYPSFLHSTTNASGHADTENSFLALLHGPPSLLQGDLQELTDRQLGSSSGGCTPAIGNSVVDSIESEAFLSSSPGVMTENLINHHLQSQAYTSAEVSFPATVSLSGGGDFIFHHVQSSNTATQPMIAGGEKPRESFFSSGQYRGTSPTSSLSVCCADIQTAPNMDFEQLTSKYATPSMNGCPRVFCMGRSGYLLLSNTGLLGIVCSCHYFHMSVLRFCEHSGLHGVNPGEAVYMESGETILQWQKLYFSMLGQREHWMVILLWCFRLGLQGMRVNGTGQNYYQQQAV